MHAVKASVILEDAYRFMGWDADQLESRQKASARTALSLALQEVWEAWWWEQLMACAQVSFTAFIYDLNNEITPGQVYYDAPEDRYMIALVAASPQLAEAMFEEYNPARGTLAAWDDAAEYAALDQFTYAGTDYQCLLDGAAAGTLPTNTTYFAPLQNWKPTIGAGVGSYGDVRLVSRFDPRTASHPGAFDLVETGDGTLVLNMAVTHPWVWARLVTPLLTGDDFDATLTYTAQATPTAATDATPSSWVLIDTVTGARRTLTVADGQITIS